MSIRHTGAGMLGPVPPNSLCYWRVFDPLKSIHLLLNLLWSRIALFRSPSLIDCRHQCHMTRVLFHNRPLFVSSVYLGRFLINPSACLSVGATSCRASTTVVASVVLPSPPPWRACSDLLSFSYPWISICIPLRAYTYTDALLVLHPRPNVPIHRDQGSSLQALYSNCLRSCFSICYCLGNDFLIFVFRILCSPSIWLFCAQLYFMEPCGFFRFPSRHARELSETLALAESLIR